MNRPAPQMDRICGLFCTSCWGPADDMEIWDLSLPAILDLCANWLCSTCLSRDGEALTEPSP